LIIAGLALQGICPIIKNIWTSTFALFQRRLLRGFAGHSHAGIAGVRRAAAAVRPRGIFGENPLLAYILCFLAAPLVIATRPQMRTPARRRRGSRMREPRLAGPAQRDAVGLTTAEEVASTSGAARKHRMYASSGFSPKMRAGDSSCRTPDTCDTGMRMPSKTTQKPPLNNAKVLVQMFLMIGADGPATRARR